MADRRQRIDSITAQVEVMQKSLIEIVPPAHVALIDADQPFWLSVISEKPKAEWSSHDLELAAMLARSMRRLDAEEAKLETEDCVLKSAGGNDYANPRLRIVADLRAAVFKYRQTLGIHNRGKEGEARDVRKRREQAFDVERDNPLDNELLARPTVQ